MIDMDKTYSTKLRIDDTTEKIFHAVQKALDKVNEDEMWTITLQGGFNKSITISVESRKGEVIKY